MVVVVGSVFTTETPVSVTGVAAAARAAVTLVAQAALSIFLSEVDAAVAVMAELAGTVTL